jgi:hypothetical protein
MEERGVEQVSGAGFLVAGVSWAQVAERLMAADCKSAAPWSYGGSNPPLCTRNTGTEGPREQGTAEQWIVKSADRDLDRKFWAALAMFAVLAVLVWLTMGDSSVLVLGKPVELKLIPLIVIGGMALRTVLARHAEKIRRSGEKDS